MKSQDNSNCAVLLIGFNRPEFIQQRLFEIGENPSFDVVVSIDGGISSVNRNLYSQIEARSDRNYFKFVYHVSNQGLVAHITGAISNILQSYQNVVVIEDDVKISKIFLDSMVENLAQTSNPRIATWGGYSPLRPMNFLQVFNCWRETVYFSAWGWGISKDSWERYNSVLPSDDFEREFKESHSWSKLNTFQKRYWHSKFRKVFENPSFTWDYQMQFMTFKYDLIHVLPIFRLTDNEGFEDSRSTNTKSKRPIWMGKVDIASLSPKRKFLPAFIAQAFLWLDSLTISGDSRILGFVAKIQNTHSFKK